MIKKIKQYFKKKKAYRNKLAYMIWEYENETLPRIEYLENELRRKDVINIYGAADLSGNKK